MAAEISGIAGVLGDLVSGEGEIGHAKAKVRKPVRTPTAAPVQHVEHVIRATPLPASRPTRLGRPPGKKAAEQPLKEKTTLWVSAEVMAVYREWSWELRCNLGELIERALDEHRRRYRDTPAKNK